MTGIERLRKLTDATLGHVHVASVTHYYEDENDVEWDERMHLSELLASIYSQINREQDAMVADSPYEALLPEDREAIAWVREHGGLAQVEMDYAMGEGFSDLADEVARRLGLCIEGLDAQDSRPLLMDALDRRLMPEGYEWPRYDTGEPVRIGGEFMGKDGKTYTAKQIQFIGKCFSLFDFCDRKPQFSGFYGERVKRPAPAVPAADGEPLEVGQTAWRVRNGEEVRVSQIDRGEHPIITYIGEDGLTHEITPDGLTHTKPEPPKRFCRDCAHWQKDPTADNMGVCWFYYHEHEGQDCYTARRGDCGACDEFMPRVRALSERDAK